MNDHDSIRDRGLDGLLDGELEAEALQQLAGHLAADAGLAAELQRRARLRRRIAGLPRDVAPARDLWPAIEGSLGAEAQAPVRRGPWRPAGSPVVVGGIWRQALAAAAGVALGGFLAWAALDGPAAPGGPGDSTQAAITGSGGAASAPTVPAAAAGEPPGFAGLDLVSARLEADYLRARESLWVELLSRRDELPPETWEVVVENLGLLDGVIRQLRAALGEDPGNRRLERMLLASHRRQLDLLQRLARQV